MNYYEKYLKYKIKYTQLKNLLINSKPISNSHITNNSYITNNQLGSGYFYEQNELTSRINLIENKKSKIQPYKFSSIYLKVDLTNQEIINKYNKIRKLILKNNSPPPFNYHITLLIFEINLDYPIVGETLTYLDKTTGKKKLRKNLLFLEEDETKSNFDSIFKNAVFTSENYDVLGKLMKIKIDSKEINVGVKSPNNIDCLFYPGSYFVDKLDINNKNLITTFRISFYERLNEFMKIEFIKNGGKTKDYVGYRSDNETDPDYILIFYDNFSKDIPFLAIKKFYYGKNTWNPHISIFNIEEVSLNNQTFLKKYVSNFLLYRNKEQTHNLIFNEIKKNKIASHILKKKMQITIDDIEFKMQV